MQTRVRLVVQGRPTSGKTTVLNICLKALEEAGYKYRRQPISKRREDYEESAEIQKVLKAFPERSTS